MTILITDPQHPHYGEKCAVVQKDSEVIIPGTIQVKGLKTRRFFFVKHPQYQEITD